MGIFQHHILHSWVTIFQQGEYFLKFFQQPKIQGGNCLPFPSDHNSTGNIITASLLPINNSNQKSVQMNK